ncbi:hypothetical protein [Nitrosopumilus sp.]|uniref:hypothetical protein n=1 Tax=Nitrosopumilus sp. TaxID=2024843 RepID=UPI00247D1D2C|nr:hypothetical protein [Nitrosopumilus sp.]MCV0431141.1 hypothetical protein [Nitrosopumilus sp.]
MVEYSKGEKMNIYDTKSVCCRSCGKTIGEIDYDATVILPECGQCANPMPEGDNILYTVSAIKHQQKQMTA